MLLVGEAPELTAAVAAGLSEGGFRVRRILPGPTTRAVSGDLCECDFRTLESVEQLRELVTKSGSEPVGAILNFLGVSPAVTQTQSITAAAALDVTTASFHLFKAFGDTLTDAAKEGGGWLLNLTGLDGQFGRSGSRALGYTAAGLTGLTKSFRQEYPQVWTRTVDLDLSAPNPLLAGRLIEELSSDDGHYEIGLSATGRYHLELRAAPLSPSDLGPLPVDKDSVVLITGGAYGITYDAALTLAKAAQPTLILVGRSPLPQPEAAATRDLDLAGLRKQIIQDRKASGQPLVPAQIEQAAKRILKDRQILDNLAALEATGSQVEYHSLDVRDAAAFGGLIDGLYERLGRLDGVLHGAGVIEDKLIRDKSLASYANVFSTKVDSALILAQRLKPAGLKFVVWFSSVSGRFGNAGQADYSAANEFLNKLSADLQRQWPATRVVAVNWGAWDAGMVSDELRKLYAGRNLGMIPVNDGLHALTRELQARTSHPEITLAATVTQLTKLVTGR